MEPHAASVDEVLEHTGSGRDGLSADEAARRLEEHGANAIRQEQEIAPWRIFLSQFDDFLIYLLFLAAGLSVAVGLLPGQEPEYTDAILIVVILLANGIFGFVQDYRAQQAMQALAAMSTPDATVVRDGDKRTVSSAEVVPGDVVALSQGDAVPADARLIEVQSLETLEAALTGESTSVGKQTGPVEADTPLAERASMVFMNTEVVSGRGRVVVVATGDDTEVGGIASMMRSADDEETPFQAEVDRLGKRLGIGVLVLIVALGAIQLLATEAAPVTVVLVAVTLAVAAVPEGLPAVVTLTLALGSRRMLQQHALIRTLPVVESLGSVDVIVTDKTGTLTENQMTVECLWFDGELWEATGAGLEEQGAFCLGGEQVDPERLEPLLRCGVVCNDAERASEDDDEGWLGDPTEVALLVVAAKAGLDLSVARVREVPFSSARKRMTVVTDGDSPVAWVKGAPEVILERCDRVWRDGEVQPLDDAGREAILEQNRALARQAYRVLGFARRELADPEAEPEELESGLVFLGLQAMIDPPRDEVGGAVEDCRRAGIRVIMATGDNLDTARSIGEAIGFDPEGARTGGDLDGLSDEQLREMVEQAEIFARVSPGHKVRILEVLQAGGHRVAMTGDGVNDAPALRNADVGIAMGIRGTDVAKEASDMVLRDDNFVTIRNAVAEGRGIFDNIRKFVNFLLSANTGEVLAVFVGVILGAALFPERFAGHAEALVLTPVMLLWINLVTDGLPALALGVDPRADDILERPPRSSSVGVISGQVLASILSLGTLVAAVGLVLFFEALAAGSDLVVAQTRLFTFLVVVEMAIIQVIRSRYHQPLGSNPWLLAAIASSLVLQGLVLYSPLSDLFGVQPIGLAGWVRIGIATAAFIVLAVASAWVVGDP